LISEDVIATAGHCVFDWSNEGYFVDYVKVYFHYEGPESVERGEAIYRWGKAAAMPAEYIKKDTDVHDVGFVCATSH
jgi:V8-like Glu-specific endopeptidase